MSNQGTGKVPVPMGPTKEKKVSKSGDEVPIKWTGGEEIQGLLDKHCPSHEHAKTHLPC